MDAWWICFIDSTHSFFYWFVFKGHINSKNYHFFVKSQKLKKPLDIINYFFNTNIWREKKIVVWNNNICSCMQDIFHAMDCKLLFIKDLGGMSTCEINENTLFNNNLLNKVSPLLLFEIKLLNSISYIMDSKKMLHILKPL